MSKKYFYLAGVIIAAASIWAIFLRPESAADSGTFDIETARVESGEVAQIVSASGAVRALTTVEVGSQVSGQIIALNADYNSEVKEGDIIARIDPQTFETRVESANADVQSAEANLAVQQANIASAEATLAQAERDFARQQALYAADAVARSTLEDNERALAVAKANLDVSRAQLRTSNATLSQRKASLRSAQVDLERTIIRSPIDGVVISRNVDVGQTVAASFSAPVLFTIAQDLEDIRIDAAVVESDIGGINTGDSAEFTVDAYPDQTFKGTVEQVRLASETLQNVVTYTVVIEAKNPSGRLLPGMTANVEVTADKRENVLRIAESAIRFRPPANGPEVIEAAAAEAGQRGPRGGGQRGGGAQLLNGINIDDDKKAAIQADLQKEMAAVRESMGERAQFDRAQMRQRIQAATDKVLLRNLTDAEYKQVQEAMKARATVTQVEVYKQTVDGKLEKQSLVLGLQDGSFAEILRGAEAGQEFVTRARLNATGE
ncbi:HlyD family secretion protein [Litorimonas taeanensis]|uniref:HlyD family secretion protein n=1 Tax=Litorimonas taeanensis TaxID=568099 RepID=A0A420WDN6_9PROT|nr:efflux RND transporter periplasmic adaptor subunit [Litorimonas taeanensis]RKQ69121.1 HlyD family secretion protein [Litorimonas taeanensis]